MRIRRTYRFKTKPWRHQIKALKKLLKMRGGALFMEMGTGKTKVYIDFACAMERKLDAKRALVLAPKSVIDAVWPREIERHAPDDSKLEWRLANYEDIRDIEYEDRIIEKFPEFERWVGEKPTVLICDEAHKFKRPTTKTARAVHKLGSLAVATVVGTGTPIAKWHLDIFSLFKAIDPGILGTSWTAFKKLYAAWGGWHHKEMLKPLRRKRLIRLIKPWTFSIRKEKCLDLPPLNHQIIPVELRESLKWYNHMAKEMEIEFRTGEVVEAPNVLTRLLRLSQISSGFLSTENGIKRVGKEKATQLYYLMEDLRANDRTKVVIFCRFLEDVRVCSVVARKLGYDPIPFTGKTKQREEKIAYFEESDEPVAFVAQVSTGSLGIDLTSASEAIFYSHTYNFAEFEQACSRLHRGSSKWRRDRSGGWVHSGGPGNRVTYYHLLATDTVDRGVWLALKTKRRLAKMVLDHPELVYAGSTRR